MAALLTDPGGGAADAAAGDLVVVADGGASFELVAPALTILPGDASVIAHAVAIHAADDRGMAVGCGVVVPLNSP